VEELCGATQAALAAAEAAEAAEWAELSTTIVRFEELDT